jgi:hypothetical protein
MLRKSVATLPHPLYAFKACKGPILPDCDNTQFGNHWNLLHPLHGGSNGNEPLLPEDERRRFLLNTYTHHKAHTSHLLEPNIDYNDPHAAQIAYKNSGT